MGFADISTSPKKRKGADGAAAGGSSLTAKVDGTKAPGSGGGGGGLNKKQADNLDHRVRVLESLELETWKFPKDAKHEILEALIIAKECWAENKPEGKASHDDGPERWTLFVALCNTLTPIHADHELFLKMIRGAPKATI